MQQTRLSAAKIFSISTLPTWYSFQKNTVRHKKSKIWRVYFDFTAWVPQLTGETPNTHYTSVLQFPDSGKPRQVKRLFSSQDPCCWDWHDSQGWIGVGRQHTGVSLRSFQKLRHLLTDKLELFLYACSSWLLALSPSSYVYACVGVWWHLWLLIHPTNTPPSLRVNCLIPDVQHFFYPLSNWKPQPLSSPQVWCKC